MKGAGVMRPEEERLFWRAMAGVGAVLHASLHFLPFQSLSQPYLMEVKNEVDSEFLVMLPFPPLLVGTGFIVGHPQGEWRM